MLCINTINKLENGGAHQICNSPTDNYSIMNNLVISSELCKAAIDQLNAHIRFMIYLDVENCDPLVRQSLNYLDISYSISIAYRTTRAPKKRSA